MDPHDDLVRYPQVPDGRPRTVLRSRGGARCVPRADQDGPDLPQCGPSRSASVRELLCAFGSQVPAGQRSGASDHRQEPQGSDPLVHRPQLGVAQPLSVISTTHSLGETLGGGLGVLPNLTHGSLPWATTCCLINRLLGECHHEWHEHRQSSIDQGRDWQDRGFVHPQQEVPWEDRPHALPVGNHGCPEEHQGPGGLAHGAGGEPRLVLRAVLLYRRVQEGRQRGRDQPDAQLRG